MKPPQNPAGSASVLSGIISVGPAAVAALAEPLKGFSPEAAFAVQCMAGLLGGVVGFAINRLESRKTAEEAALPASAEQVGLNHHLARLAGTALQTMIDEEAKQHPEKSPARLALAHASARAERAWLAVLDAPSGENFRKLNSARLTDAAAGQALAPSGVFVLDAEEWKPFATFVLTGHGQKGPLPDLAQALAERFEKDFARHFLEHAKHSSEKDPPAFAALLIQFLAELRFTQREHDAEFAALRSELGKIVAALEVATAEKLHAPGFDWEKLTTHLAEAKEAHEEARTFYKAAKKDFDELLPLARDTWRLIRDVHGTQHQALIQAVAGLNLLVQDKVSEVLRELRLGQRDPLSGAALIVDYIRAQRELDAEANRKFEGFIRLRDDIRGRGGHHYFQPEKWTPGHRTRKLWREAGIVFVPRPPLSGAADVPPAGSNFYLWGESGHGKSILAANIADRLIAQGYRALTFNLRQAGDILRHLALLTDKEWLGLDAPKEAEKGWTDETAKIVAACTWLLEDAREGDGNHPRFCLVWDNADDLVTLDHLFQLQLLHHRGVQIITTRIPPTAFRFPAHHPCHDWPPRLLKIQRVGPYSEAEAREHVRQFAGQSEAEGTGAPLAADHERILHAAQAEGTREHFDPLKLNDVLTSLRCSGWKIETVLGPEVVLAPTPTTPTPTPAPERSHAEVLAQTIDALPALARAVWRLLVHFAPAPIPEQWWRAIEGDFREPENVPEAERAAIASELRGRLPVVKVRAALAEAGLLTGGDDGDLVHTRHYATGREAVPAELRPFAYRQAVRVLRAAAPSGFPTDDIDTWPFYRTAEPHLLAALAPERAEAIAAMRETGWLTNRFNAYLLAQSRLGEARWIAELNLRSNVAVDGEGSENHAVSLHELARLHLEQGRYAEAEEGFRKALDIYQQHGRENHPSFATTLHELARLHLEQGRYAEAEEGFRKALGIDRQHHGDESWEAATSRSNLALILWARGERAEAEAIFARSLAVFERVLGVEHSRVAGLLHRWAECELAPIPGDDAASPPARATVDRVRRALDIRRAVLPAEHSDTAQTRLLLAECLRRQRALHEAHAEAERAAAALAAALPEAHPANTKARALCTVLRA